MPIISDAAEPKHRFSPVLAVLLAVVLLPTVGLFVWSVFNRVYIPLGERVFTFGKQPGAYRTSVRYTKGFAGPGSWLYSFDIPGTRDQYVVAVGVPGLDNTRAR